MAPIANLCESFMSHRQPAAATSQSLFFLLCALLPWLNPVSGGAMTPGIPLLLGWLCIVLLFVSFPAFWGSATAVYAGVFVVTAAVGSIFLNTSWQLLAVGVAMIGAAAAVGAHCAQLRDGQTGHDAQAGIRLIAWSWLLAGLINAAIGLLQAKQWAGWLEPLVNYAPPGNIYGNLRQRNQFATLMTMALWALWYLWSSYGLGAGKRWARTGWAWALTLPLLLALSLTLSRTGFLQVAALVLMLVWWHGRGVARAQSQPLWPWLVFVVVVYALASWKFPHLFAGGTDLFGRLDGSDTRACVSRTVLWHNVWTLALQKPWTGWGWGELAHAHYAANYSELRFCLMLDNAHNLPLHMAFSFGLPVALALVLGVLWWVLRQRVWAEMSAVRQLMWGVLAMIAIHSLVEYPLWYSPFMLALGLALGVLWTWPRAGAQPLATPVDTRIWHYGQVTVGMLMLAGVLYASFDFVRVTQLYTEPQDRVWPFKERTVEQAQRTLLYQNAVAFAGVTTIPLTPANAEQQLAQARALMTYSPEARVVQRIIESLRVLGRDAEADREEVHFQEVYPSEYQAWKAPKDDTSEEEQLQ